MTPRLACFDLDNTLIDRDGAFLAWAQWWGRREGLGADGVEWLLAHDQGGFRPRADLFAGVKERFGLAADVTTMVDAYDREHPPFVSVARAVVAGLVSLRTAGWRVAVVTNGGVLQQSLKLERTGIGAVVDYCCISEAVGVRKPDPRIFKIAATQTGATLIGGWMVGDHPAYDIAGGIAAGLSTVLVGNHHPTAATPRRAPTRHFASVLQAFPAILNS
ncbi:HAD family hydrolase [Streptomyces sp. SID13031]|uniref:HAD family hydrolase n=1 Tax=Streptomyces sp. SID13031 TaxID=2706046 RepID=UPI0013C83D95|nr:HAD family hydrolase [Streptomyces sp. SID13031]NEA32606.1 HAD family hydrolase [Streptomyces sp. SID13031]